MKRFKELLKEQYSEVSCLRNETQILIDKKLASCNKIKGILLTGSVARGDAKIEPFGILIDLCIVIDDGETIDLNQIVGEDEKPYIPYHCISISAKIGFQIEVKSDQYLLNIRNRSESEIFSKNEALILMDTNNFLSDWKKNVFKIEPAFIKKRALQNYFRFCYLTGEYRYEKWHRRDDWLQITQLFNEASECYCNFLYCINNSFIPRKDWLVYLLQDLEIKPEQHTRLIHEMYTSKLNREFNDNKLKSFIAIKTWMDNYCKINNWI